MKKFLTNFSHKTQGGTSHGQYLDMEDYNEPLHPPKDSTSLLDLMKPVIDQWLLDDLKAPRKKRHTAKRVFERLQAEYPQMLEL